MIRAWLARLVAFLLALVGAGPAQLAHPAQPTKARATSAAQLRGSVGTNRPNRASLLSAHVNPVGRRRRAYVRARRGRSRKRVELDEQLQLEAEAARMYPVPISLAKELPDGRR